MNQLQLEAETIHCLRCLCPCHITELADGCQCAEEIEEIKQTIQENRATVELHFITCPCERCKAVREERKGRNDESKAG